MFYENWMLVLNPTFGMRIELNIYGEKRVFAKPNSQPDESTRMIGLAQNSYNYQGNERVHLGPVEVQARNATVSLDGETDWLLRDERKNLFY